MFSPEEKDYQSELNEVFLNAILPQLIESLTMKAQYNNPYSQELVLDFLAYLIRFNWNILKDYMLQHSILQNLTHLYRHPSKHIKLGILKVFKACLENRDDMIYQYIIKYDLFAEIFRLMQNNQRDNMVCSACLNIIWLVGKQEIKSLICYIMEKHKVYIVSGTLAEKPVMKAIKLKYENAFKPSDSNHGKRVFLNFSTRTETREIHLKCNEELESQDSISRKRICPENITQEKDSSIIKYEGK